MYLTFFYSIRYLLSFSLLRIFNVFNFYFIDIKNHKKKKTLTRKHIKCMMTSTLHTTKKSFYCNTTSSFYL